MKRLLLSILATFGLAGTALAAPPAEYRIAVIGDSLSAQNWLMADAWPAVLERNLRQSTADVKVYNFAVAGHTFYRANTVGSFGGQTAVQATLSVDPHVVVVALGYNDTVMDVDGRSLSQVQADFDALIYALRTKSTLYVAERSTDADWIALDAYIRGAWTWTFSAFTSWDLTSIHTLGGGLPDGLHLNGAGAVMQAAVVSEAIRARDWIPGLMRNPNDNRNLFPTYSAAHAMNPLNIDVRSVKSSLRIP